MGEEVWIGVTAFGALAGISRQAAHKALGNAFAKKRWRGCELEVRVAHGRGGRSGLIYEVAVRSILTAVTHASPAEEPAASGYGFEGSSRNVRRKLAALSTGGGVALARKRPANAGQRRVSVSRAFNRAFLAWGGDQVTADRVHHKLTSYVRALWTDRAADAGATVIARLASKHLLELVREAGIVPTRLEARAALAVPRAFVEPHRPLAAVNRKRTDATAHYNARPGALRDLNALRPMELVMGDVHHLDVRFHRIDGEPAFSVKMVAFMDVGNRRVHASFVNVAKGRGIRQEEVAMCFAGMANRPDFGMPETLCVDNGSEFGFFDYFVDAFRLMGRQDGRGRLIHSQAYNARGKAALESFFRHFESHYLALFPGYAGGDRQRQKTANQGREVTPAPWDWEAAHQILCAALDEYNATPRDCLNDVAPADTFEAARSPDWSAVTVSAEALAYGFAKREERTNQQGTIQLAGKVYRLTGPALAARKVTVLHAPWMTAGVLIENAGELTFAAPAKLHHPMSREGAREAGQLRSAFDREVLALAAGLPTIDPLAALLSDHPSAVDLLEHHKPAVRQALSAKARSQERDREATAEQERSDKQAETLRRLASGGPRGSKVA